MKAGLAPLTTIRSKEHAKMQAEESMNHAKLQREKLMNMVQDPKSTIKHNIVDFGGPYDLLDGEDMGDWSRINKMYLCEHVLVSLYDGTLKRTTNTYIPQSTDIAISFPVTGSGLYPYFSGLKGADNSYILGLIGHAASQVDTTKHLCIPIKDLEKFGNDVLAISSLNGMENNQTIEENDLTSIAMGGAGVWYPEEDSHETDKVLKTFTCKDPWENLLNSKNSSSNPRMLKMIETFFSTICADGIAQGKLGHLDHEICITSKEFSGTSKKSTVPNQKMVSIRHTMAPVNSNHYLATLVLNDTKDSYTHVALLDMGKGKKSHANLVASFYALARHALSSGGPGSNPFHVSEGRIRDVKMVNGNYDYAQASNSLSFFYAPRMQLSLIGSTSYNTPSKEFEVGMSVHSLRHLPDNVDVILGSAMEIDQNPHEWVRDSVQKHADHGRFPSLRK